MMARSRILHVALVLAVPACGKSSLSSPVVDSGTPSPDATQVADAALDAGSNSPIVATPDQWTWVDFPTALCASGTATGIAVNPSPDSTELLLYLEGGGDCVDATGCWGTMPTATHLTGYDATTFAQTQLVPALDRTATGNPFAGMNMVFVPYCTGDLHSGTVLANLASGSATIPTYFYGGLDMNVYLTRLVATFPHLQRVWLAGASAGGFGTYMTFSRVATAFGVGVDMIDDSGPPLVDESSTTGNNAALFDIWGTVAGLPPGCATCKSFRDVLNYDLQVQQTFSPVGEFGFLSFLEDTTISADFGYNAVTQYPSLMTTFSASLPTNGTAATYLVSNYESHVVQTDAALAPQYFPWMTLMYNRDPSWADATYDAGP